MQNEQLQVVFFLFNVWWAAGITAFVVVELPVLLLRPFRLGHEPERGPHAAGPTTGDPAGELQIETYEIDHDPDDDPTEAPRAPDESVECVTGTKHDDSVRVHPQQGGRTPMRGRRGGWRRRGG